MDGANKDVKLLDVRLSFPKLFTPEGFGGSAENPKYSASFLIPKNDAEQVNKVMDAMKEVAKMKWADKSEAVFKTLLEEKKICLRNGDSKEFDGYAGCFYLSANNAAKPLVFDRNNSKIEDESLGRPYAGCYVNAVVRIFAFDGGAAKGGKRICATLLKVQFSRDGDAFGSVRTTEEFDDLTVGENGGGDSETLSIDDLL